MQHILLVFFLVFLTSANAIECSALVGQIQKAKVLKVKDGDTATVLIKEKFEVDVRFHGVDTPESAWQKRWPAQPFSMAAKTFVNQLISKKMVNIKFTGDGTYTRCVGEVFVGNKSISLALVENGLAWWYKNYSPKRKDLESAQINAQKNKIGIWSDPNPTPPWQYREKYFGGLRHRSHIAI